MTTGLVYEEHTPVVNMVRMTIHYACKNRSHVGRSKSSLQILDHEPPCLLLWQSPMHCVICCIFTYALGTGVAHIFAKFSTVEQCVRHSKELHRLYDRGT